MAERKRTYFYFGGIALAADGGELILDYSDPDQGGTRLLFRYVISLTAPPRLIAGYGPELTGAGKEIGYKEIPHDVVGDACDWLRSNVKAASERNKEGLCRILSDHLKFFETGERPTNKLDTEGLDPQQRFSW